MLDCLMFKLSQSKTILFLSRSSADAIFAAEISQTLRFLRKARLLLGDNSTDKRQSVLLHQRATQTGNGNLRGGDENDRRPP